MAGDNQAHETSIKNQLKWAGIHRDTVEFILSLPNCPTVDNSTLMIHAGTQWFEDRGDYGVVFRVLKTTPVEAIKVFDFREGEKE